MLRQLNDEKQIGLLNAVFETQESERKRLAEDLHDSVGQLLSAIKLNLHRLDKNCVSEGNQPLFADTRQLANDCIHEIRNIIHNVLPPVLTDYGLLPALEGLCTGVEQMTGVKVRYTNNGVSGRFPSDIELSFYRLAQELFGNAIKHSEAKLLTLSISKDANWLIMEFTDNGKGFDPDTVKSGFGLKNLQSRVQFIKGEINIYTKPQNGTITIIKVMIP